MNDNQLYLQHVTQLGDKVEIRVAEDIRNQQGVLLLAKGALINSNHCEIIIQHKLLAPLDTSISIADSVSGASLARNMQTVLASSNNLMINRLNRSGIDSSTLLTMLRGFRPNILLTNKLTVLEKNLPHIFRHCLEVAANAYTIATLCRLSATERQQLLFAGILHDIGELHIEPYLLDPGYRLSGNDWRQIHAHPVIGYLILKEFPEYRVAFGRPIIEHHERLDGSGYPKRLQNDAISLFGRIIAIAETVTGVLQHDTVAHLECVLKLMQRKLDKSLIAIVINNLHADINPSPVMSNELPYQSFAAWSELTGIFQSWQTLNERVDSVLPQWVALNTRINEVKLLTYEAGNFFDHQVLQAIGNDPALFIEITSLIQESLYQIRQGINDFISDMPMIEGKLSPAVLASVKTWLKESLQAIETAYHYL